MYINFITFFTASFGEC